MLPENSAILDLSISPDAAATVRSCNRPLEDWGNLVRDVPSATAILDCLPFLVETFTITGKSYRLREQARAKKQNAKPGGNAESDNDCESRPA